MKTALKTIWGLMLALPFVGCGETATSWCRDLCVQESMMSYTVGRLTEPMCVDGNWDKPQWKSADTLRLSYYMGQRPEHFPKVQAKLLYDEQAVYVIFRVEDKYVRAVAPQHQARVCADSCVEFFFTPGQDTAQGYFNLEMNCGGTMLLHYQLVPRQNSVALQPADLEQIQVASSLPRIIDPEIAVPTVWTVEYRLPVAILSKYIATVQQPGPGVVWRANFFKCADATSHPHWLTWAPVHRPKPDFHRPRDFDRLRFK